MPKPLPSMATRAEELTSRDLPLRQPQEPPRCAFPEERRPAERIKDALIRWLEEEL